MWTSKVALRIFSGIALGVAVVFILSLFVTNPDELGPFGITLWFGAFFISLAGLLFMVLYNIRRLVSKKDKQLLIGVSLRYAILLGLWATYLIALNSLGQLGIRDVILITLLLVLIQFYLRRRQ